METAIVESITKPMKKFLMLFAVIALTGCSGVSHSDNVRSTASVSSVRYQHELEYVSADGWTPFLHLVEIEQ